MVGANDLMLAVTTIENPFAPIAFEDSDVWYLAYCDQEYHD